jgi:hypothetical protein
MDPDFKDTDDLNSSYCPREFGGIAEDGVRSYIDKIYPIWSRDMAQRYPNHNSFSWYQAVCPNWLQEELKRLFPEAMNPVPVAVSSDRGKFNCWISGLFILDDDGKKCVKNFVTVGRTECQFCVIWWCTGVLYIYIPVSNATFTYSCVTRVSLQVLPVQDHTYNYAKTISLDVTKNSLKIFSLECCILLSCVYCIQGHYVGIIICNIENIVSYSILLHSTAFMAGLGCIAM